MSRNFIRLRGELVDGCKVFQAAQTLGVSRDEALGMMCRWLLWVDAHCETDETGLTCEQVDELMGHAGFAGALEEIGWIAYKGGEVVFVCEFDKYLSPTAKVRMATARRVAACKARKMAAAAGVELPAGLKAKRAGTRLRKSGQAASATPRRVASETTSTRKGGRK